ncbi:MAG: phosphoglucomutase [Bradymonadales bacterium]|nr:phosphoglucomutase [Bradymonadales bacterium]
MDHPLAGKRPDRSTLVAQSELEARYFRPETPLQPIKNGTSGHRGKTGSAFSQFHVAAMTQALADIRKQRGSYGPDPVRELGVIPSPHKLGPIVLAKDVRYTSDYAQQTAAEVFAGNRMRVLIQDGERATPTPVVSHAILSRVRRGELAEGAILTASHNPPDDAGYKTNGLDGGPNTRTREIDELANRYLEDPRGIKRIAYLEAAKNGLVIETDLMTPYVTELADVVEMEVIRGTPFGATSLGGSAHGYYEAINGIHGTDIKVVLPDPDPASAHRTYDWDGRLRGDPSSAYVMKAIEGQREALQVPFVGANDNDADRFGGEDGGGTLNPNQVLCVVFDYLLRHRDLPNRMGVGRTIGTTHLLDLIAREHDRPVHEVNVGFKWYVQGLIQGRYLLAGEESAGLCIPRRDGSTWITEKDGILAVLLMMEIISRTGEEISTLYRRLVERYGPHQYERVDMPATAARKERLLLLSANQGEVERLLSGRSIASRPVERLVVGDGIKVVLEGGIWVLKRASGTEDIIKDYREERGDRLDTARQASHQIDALLGLADG